MNEAISPHFQYAFMTRYSVKAQRQLYLYLQELSLKNGMTSSAYIFNEINKEGCMNFTFYFVVYLFIFAILTSFR
jgi:hypothetical protein